MYSLAEKINSLSILTGLTVDLFIKRIDLTHPFVKIGMIRKEFYAFLLDILDDLRVYLFAALYHSIRKIDSQFHQICVIDYTAFFYILNFRIANTIEPEFFRETVLERFVERFVV
ncbi:hypothetical protein SDC9_156914 [bioreactor metagenome]|uniref:Uncharacterized protein n=1 Tax=bioreactor metagenome TaxID=1076179 RepID=A0A645FAY9_9ZZZZ